MSSRLCVLLAGGATGILVLSVGRLQGTSVGQLAVAARIRQIKPQRREWQLAGGGMGERIMSAERAVPRAPSRATAGATLCSGRSSSQGAVRTRWRCKSFSFVSATLDLIQNNYKDHSDHGCMIDRPSAQLFLFCVRCEERWWVTPASPLTEQDRMSRAQMSCFVRQTLQKQ